MSTTPTERAFPRRYASIRRAVKDIRDLGGDFYATVEGRDTDTGDPIVISGAVEDIEFRENESVASLLVDTGDDHIRVGGLVAAYESVEGQAIHIGRESPPDV